MNAAAYYYKQLKKYNEDPNDLRSPDDFSIDCMIEFTKEANGKLMPEPKVGQRLSQIDVFHIIISQMGWYKGIKKRQNAFLWKKHFLNGTLGGKSIERMFNKFGFKKCDTIWVKIK